MSGIDIRDRRRSPLDEVALPDFARELPFLAQIGLRGDPAGVAASAATVLGFALPREPNTVTADGDLAALWLGPDEWLIVGPGGREADLEASLRAALAAAGGSVVDVSANRTAIELRGPRARDVLESGCPLDLDPRVFGPGDCAQTLFARVQVIIWHTAAAPEPTYRLLVRPSFAAYLAAWLSDAADAD